MSLQSATPVAFLYASERERALGFYRDILGFALKSADAHGDFIDMGAALIRLTVMPGFKASPHPALGWNVDDIGAAAEALRAKGVEFIVYEGMGQDSLGVWTAPDGKAKVAWFADPDGNLLSLSQT